MNETGLFNHRSRIFVATQSKHGSIGSRPDERSVAQSGCAGCYAGTSSNGTARWIVGHLGNSTPSEREPRSWFCSCGNVNATVGPGRGRGGSIIRAYFRSRVWRMPFVTCYSPTFQRCQERRAAKSFAKLFGIDRLSGLMQTRKGRLPSPEVA